MLSADRQKKATHTGKQSDQEKAANKRKEFGDIRYNTQTATNIMTAYYTKKEEILAQREEAPQNIQLTGKEFLMPPTVDRMDEANALSQRIVGVMFERDRLSDKLKSGKKENKTPYGKARAKCEEQLLNYMNDVIKTFFTSNGVADLGEKAISKKDQETAKKHMALAMEKYEMYVRTFEETVAQESIKLIANKNSYKESREQKGMVLRPQAEGEKMMLMNKIGVGMDRVKSKTPVLKKVYAEFEKSINARTDLKIQMDMLEDEELTMMQGQCSEQEMEAAQKSMKAMADSLRTQYEMLDFVVKACSNYILSQASADPIQLDLREATYITMHFKVNDASTGSLDLHARMKDQLGAGFNEYDRGKKAKLKEFLDKPENAEQKKIAPTVSNFSKVFNWYNDYDETVSNAPKVYELQHKMDTVTEDFDYSKERSTGRDVERLYCPIFQGEVPDEKSMREYVKNDVILRSGHHLGTDVPVTHEERKEAYNKQLPFLRAKVKELNSYIEKYPNKFENWDDGDVSRFIDNYASEDEAFRHSQAISDVLKKMMKDKDFFDTFTEEEQEECVHMTAIAGAMQNIFGALRGNRDMLNRLTPMEYVNKEYKIINPDMSYKKYHDDLLAEHRKKFKTK